MEKLKPKHDHALTNIVKVFIFALMLLMPFLVFLPNGLYYGFNEHATNDTTTEINYKYESNEVNSLGDLVDEHIYNIDELFLSDTTLPNAEFTFVILKFDSLDSSDGFGFDDSYLNINYDSRDVHFVVTFNPSSLESYVEITTFIGGEYLSYIDLNNHVELTFYNCVFIYESSLLPQFTRLYQETNFLPEYTDYNVIESVTENVEQTITQQMYNGWQNMWQTPLFNWTSNSILNTGLTAFCTAFGISNTSYITNFLTYELVIVAIYIVLDIVLTLFTWLTHIGQKD